MPVIDLKDSYVRSLPRRDWLYAVNAIAKYHKNQYRISKDGKKVKLQGKIFTQKEVELTTSSSESEELSSSDEESSTEEDNVVHK